MRQNSWPYCLLIIASGLLCFASHSAIGQSTAEEIERVEISPAWAGSAQQTQATVTIANVHGVFRRTWNPLTITADYNSIRIVVSSSDQPADLPVEETRAPQLSHDTVDRRDVLSLVRALDAPPLKVPSLSNLGIDKAWLEDQAADSAKNFGDLAQPDDVRQQAFLRKSLTDLNLIARTLPRVVGSSWTDDPVWVHVLARFSNGRTIEAETMNQPPFMLPWTVKTHEGQVRTFDSSISLAVAKLLPGGSVNKERLQGSGLMRLIVFQMDGSIKKRWQEIGAEDRAGNPLDRLRGKYAIRRTEVSEHISLHYGSDRSERGEEFFEADLQRPGFPENLRVATVFRLQGAQAVGLDSFFQNGNRYERMVLDNPWIMESLKRHPDLGAWLVYVGDASMSEKAMKVFAADMHELGRDDLAQEVSAHRADVADLSYYGNEVLLFPDHHAILWRWDPNRDLFGWPASRVKTQECTDYPTLYVGCSAAVVGPDGQLEK